MSLTDYTSKYLKYKAKYIELKKQLGGTPETIIFITYRDKILKTFKEYYNYNDQREYFKKDEISEADVEQIYVEIKNADKNWNICAKTYKIYNILYYIYVMNKYSIKTIKETKDYILNYFDENNQLPM